MKGKTVTARLAAEVADLGASEIEPISDIRGDGSFRRDMARTACRRTIEDLFNPAGSAATSAA